MDPVRPVVIRKTISSHNEKDGVIDFALHNKTLRKEKIKMGALSNFFGRSRSEIVQSMLDGANHNESLRNKRD